MAQKISKAAPKTPDGDPQLARIIELLESIDWKLWEMMKDKDDQEKSD